MCRSCWAQDVTGAGLEEFQRTKGDPATLHLAELITQAHAWTGDPNWFHGPAHAQINNFNTDITIDDIWGGPRLHTSFEFEGDYIQMHLNAVEHWGEDLAVWANCESPWFEFVDCWNEGLRGGTDEDYERAAFRNTVALGMHEGFVL